MTAVHFNSIIAHLLIAPNFSLDAKALSIYSVYASGESHPIGADPRPWKYRSCFTLRSGFYSFSVSDPLTLQTPPEINQAAGHPLT